MNKENQSLVDFFNSFPSLVFAVPRSPISNNEADVLYNIWLNGARDEYGKYVIPQDVNTSSISSLDSKGYLKRSQNRMANSNSCEITSKGRDVIQKIILYKEKSSFGKQSKIKDFEGILASNQAQVKTASKIQPQNWLQRFCGS